MEFGNELPIKIENEDFHYELVKEEEIFEDPVYSYIEETNIQEENLNFTNEEVPQKYYCSYCVLKFEKKEELMSHEKDHEEMILKSSQKTPKPPKQKIRNEKPKETSTSLPDFAISDSDSTFPERYKVIDYEASRPYKCEYCGRGFIFETNLRTHKIAVHKEGLRPTPVELQPAKNPVFKRNAKNYKTSFDCSKPSCNRKFDNYAEYQNHMIAIHAQIIMPEEDMEPFPASSQVKIITQKLRIDKPPRKSKASPPLNPITPITTTDEESFPSRFGKAELKTYSRKLNKVMTYSRKRTKDKM